MKNKFSHFELSQIEFFNTNCCTYLTLNGVMTNQPMTNDSITAFLTLKIIKK
jgi:hypothetical protein